MRHHAGRVMSPNRQEQTNRFSNTIVAAANPKMAPNNNSNNRNIRSFTEQQSNQPDLSHLSPEERRIIENVIHRQKEDEMADVQRNLK